MHISLFTPCQEGVSLSGSQSKKCRPVNDGALQKSPLTDSSDAYWHWWPQQLPEAPLQLVFSHQAAHKSSICSLLNMTGSRMDTVLLSHSQGQMPAWSYVTSKRKSLDLHSSRQTNCNLQEQQASQTTTIDCRGCSSSKRLFSVNIIVIFYDYRY